ncbi:primosomal protein N' [Carnobacteriaceae bacterium zg-C25]|nr:primosomal protein N' [Carnobacteriaceae bacterium zg-C25]
MLTIAKVIVDVPSHQTNQTYDYLIPDALREDVGIGFRVRVPFGSRIVQGYVVDVILEQSSEYDLKPIHSLLDDYPVLTSELVSLGQQLAKQTFAFAINCYHVMLPALLKVDYDKTLTWIGNEADKPDWFVKESLSWDEIVDVERIRFVLKAIQSQQIRVDYVVKDKANHKMRKLVHLVHTQDVVIRKGSPKLSLLHELLLKQTPLDMKELNENGVSLATVKSAVKQGWATIESVVDYRNPFNEKQFALNVAKVLNQEQQNAFLTIKQSILQHQHHTYLLQGVTGSGKTEVYMHLIQEVIQKGKSALMLVPEIALTPQMVNQFKGRFGNRVAVLHSGLSKGEKFDEWTKIRKKEASIVVGARSSIYAPIDNLGIIIIDEEHETTYKQMDTVRYHARDVAIMRGQYHHCPVVLGSATPSLESRARAQKGVYTHILLNQRANQKALPTVQVVDMTKEKKSGNFDVFSQSLKEAIQTRLDQKEQVVLLLNRRGYSSFVMCRDCGYVLPCPNCDISMTLHMDTKTMKCHYCDHQEKIPHICPSCQSKNIRYYGLGTQKVEEELNQLFPDARVVRMDVDTTRKKGQHEKLLDTFGSGKADILLGTQMIAKGLDFPNITLVGVINADTSLNLPDFRSSEKTFQLLTQVAGRSGRGEKAGEVIIQTYNPEHYAITLSQQHNYEMFYRQEMKMRHLGKYAPFFFSTRLSISHHSEATALKTALELKKIIEQYRSDDLIVVGPSTHAIARINNHYYFQILLKYKNKAGVEPLQEAVLAFTQEKSKQKIYVSIDVEPLSFI